MLRLLEVYKVTHQFSDHPVYAGERYRSGGVLSVPRSTEVRPLYLLAGLDNALDNLYMAEIVDTHDKIRLYEGDVMEGETANIWDEVVDVVAQRPEVARTVTTPVSTWHIGPFATNDPTPYVNTADSILREDNE